jgi:hypothetical protein
MAVYIEYLQEDGSVLLVEVNASADQAVKASNRSGNTFIKAEQSFKDALKSIKSSVATLWQGFADIQADDIEVTFGIKTVGEVGFFAVCKAGAEVNYEVKLHWTKSTPHSIGQAGTVDVTEKRTEE